MTKKSCPIAGWAAVAAVAMVLAGCASMPPYQGLPLTLSAGSNDCCSFCGFFNDNNYNAGYNAYAGYPFTIEVSRYSSMYPLLSSSDYCARWRYGGQTNETGCFQPFGPTQQQFIAPVTAQYALTVYIKTNCPPAGTKYYTRVNIASPPP